MNLKNSFFLLMWPEGVYDIPQKNTTAYTKLKDRMYISQSWGWGGDDVAFKYTTLYTFARWELSRLVFPYMICIDIWYKYDMSLIVYLINGKILTKHKIYNNISTNSKVIQIYFIKQVGYFTQKKTFSWCNTHTKRI